MKSFKNLLFVALCCLSFLGCHKLCIDTKECLLRPEVGECDAAFERFYYNPVSGKCESFTWGGCGGVVPFETLEECQSGCGCD